MSWNERAVYDTPGKVEDYEGSMTQTKDRNRVRALVWSQTVMADGVRLPPYAMVELRTSYSRILDESEDSKSEAKQQRALAKRWRWLALLFGSAAMLLTYTLWWHVT